MRSSLHSPIVFATRSIAPIPPAGVHVPNLGFSSWFIGDKLEIQPPIEQPLRLGIRVCLAQQDEVFPHKIANCHVPCGPNGNVEFAVFHGHKETGNRFSIPDIRKLPCPSNAPNPDGYPQGSLIVPWRSFDNFNFGQRTVPECIGAD